MSNSQQKYTGTRYTTTVALLIVAFVFSPAVLMLSRPFGSVATSIAVACSALCVAFAWVNWKRHSELTILSIASVSSRSR
jgi:hypothetical protein